MKNLNTSLPEMQVHWTAREIRAMASSAYRDLADERRVAGDLAGAQEFERLAEHPEATLEAARKAWEAFVGGATQSRAGLQAEPRGLEMDS